jgi:hypothetical protein
MNGTDIIKEKLLGCREIDAIVIYDLKETIERELSALESNNTAIMAMYSADIISACKTLLKYNLTPDAYNEYIRTFYREGK